MNHVYVCVYISRLWLTGVLSYETEEVVVCGLTSRTCFTSSFSFPSHRIVVCLGFFSGTLHEWVESHLAIATFLPSLPIRLTFLFLSYSFTCCSPSLTPPHAQSFTGERARPMGYNPARHFDLVLPARLISLINRPQIVFTVFQRI